MSNESIPDSQMKASLLIEYYDEFSRSPDLPEYRLLRAFLSRAIFDTLSLSKDITALNRREAETYIASDTKDEWGFLWVCDNLSLNPRTVRAAITALAQTRSVLKSNEQAVANLVASLQSPTPIPTISPPHPTQIKEEEKG